ncbi:hypothetical protein Poli38472_000498 [Pythium oligandrum]|uniref:Protein YIF1 n=1 Tax=Pythium oligandrum TaxID=41045 RepID=A0A8K1CBU8_PYTOL|nr:hypothetical protein Poli38472_000498 [Pythium oligandrum]|eukprot:TMW60456.1 hypothetical protein Poli38472_000498 [Pythium oligandrum]
MAQYGGSPFGHAVPPQQQQFHAHPQPQQQRQPRPTPAYSNFAQQQPQQQFHSQPVPPRPFPGAPQQPQPRSAPQHHQQPPQQQHQQFYASPEYQQPAMSAPHQQQQQHTSYNFGAPNQSAYQQTPPSSQSGPGSSNRPMHPQQRAQHHQQQQQQPDFMNQISQNPMAGLAMNTAQDFLSKQSAIYLPGAYGVWGSLKYYFTVNNSYVKSRLKMLLFPFWHRNWRRMGTESTDGKPNQYAPPSRDINAPDLYIPLMGFLTYILIVGYTKGASNQFSPDVIGRDASYCLVMQLVEIGVLAACLYLLNSSISFLDLVSFSGYKYIPLVVNTVVYQLAGALAYYVVLLYTGIAVSFFTLNCMKGSVAEPTPENRTFRNYLLFGVSCLQLVLVCWISYTTAPRE